LLFQSRAIVDNSTFKLKTISLKFKQAVNIAATLGNVTY